MRFACIGDIHGRLDRLRRVVDWLADVEIAATLLVGDFTPGQDTLRFGRADMATVEGSLAVVNRLGVPTLFVPGNHDLRDQASPGNIDGRVEIIGALRFAGIGGAGPARFGFPYEWTEEEVRRRDVPVCDVLLSHAPPARTALDRVRTGRHAGSEAIRELAEGMSGMLICGHIHEAGGVELIERCICYNTGSLGEPFGRCQVGVVEWAAGSAGTTVTHHDLDSGKSWEKAYRSGS